MKVTTELLKSWPGHGDHDNPPDQLEDQMLQGKQVQSLLLDSMEAGERWTAKNVITEKWKVSEHELWWTGQGSCLSPQMVVN